MVRHFLLPALGFALLLSGCDWFDGGGSSPLHFQKPRQGVDRQVAPASQLPEARAPAGYDAAVAPENQARQDKVGAVLAAQGGQQAQKAKQEKAIADVKAQWQREQSSEISGAALPAPQDAPTVQ